LIDFKLHDFGFRGVSSWESAVLGGMAHLVNFMGTDTIGAILGVMEYYDAPVCGFSIPAMEHSTVTSWGRDGEVKAFRNMLKLFGKPNALLACVSDSYDIYEACKKWGTELKEDVIKSGAVVVIRPDSGEPSSVVVKCLMILDKYFGSTMIKGYKVLNHVRIIQGDGIDHKAIQSILFSAQMAGFSADNIAFGQGGALLQLVSRDDLEFAMKCSAAFINGEWIDVYKDPITSSMKKSLKGRLALIKDSDGKFLTVRLENIGENEDALKLRYRNGDLHNQTTFDQIRGKVREGVQ
jgi:nicotinamide phosphoribosyltransferase